MGLDEVHDGMSKCLFNFFFFFSNSLVDFIVWKLERISRQLLWHKIAESTIIVNEVVFRYFETLFTTKFRKKIFYSLARNREINVRKFLIRKWWEQKITWSKRTRRWIYHVFTILIFLVVHRRIAAFQLPGKNARRGAFFTAVHTAKRVRYRT